MPREDRSRPSDVSSGSPDSSSANSPTTSPDSSVSRAREEPPSPKGASSAPSSPSRSVSFSQKLTKAVAGEDPPRTSTKDSKDQHGATTAPAAGKSPPATASAPLARGRGPAAQQTPTRTISFDSATQKVQETMKAQTGLLREYFRALEPFRYRKGGGGRVAIWGGSALYAGAPYFAGTASLKAGADLVYLKVGHPSVAQALKARSPDLMCDATGDGLHFSEDDREVVGRCHCLVIGPGLGRNEEVLKEVKRVLKRSASWWPGLPIVLDADALHADPDCLKDRFRALEAGYTVLTPNVVERGRFPDRLLELFSEAILTGGLQNKSVTENLEVKTFERVSSRARVIIEKGKTDMLLCPPGVVSTSRGVTADGLEVVRRVDSML